MVTHNHAARKPRPPLYEPRYQVEKHYPYAAMKPTSLVTKNKILLSFIRKTFRLSLGTISCGHQTTFNFMG